MVLALVGASVAVGWLTAPSADKAENLAKALAAGARPASGLFPGDWEQICLGTPYMTPSDLLADRAEGDTCAGWTAGAQGEEGTSLVVLAESAGGACKVLTVPRALMLVDRPGCRAFSAARLGLETLPAGEKVLGFAPVERQGG